MLSFGYCYHCNAQSESDGDHRISNYLIFVDNFFDHHDALDAIGIIICICQIQRCHIFGIQTDLRKNLKAKEEAYHFGYHFRKYAPIR